MTVKNKDKIMGKFTLGVVAKVESRPHAPSGRLAD
jgi:uncharacterized protein YwbE